MDGRLRVTSQASSTKGVLAMNTPSNHKSRRAVRLASGTATAVLLTSAALAGGPRFSDWSTPVNLGAPVNSAFQDGTAKLSRDGHSLFFTSNRPCGADDAVNDFNLWVSHRRNRNSPWQEPLCLTINVNARVAGDAPYQDREPELSRDGHWLYFVSDRPGSLGGTISGGTTGGDIWASYRQNVHDDDGWSPPFPLTGINTDASERSPAVFESPGHCGARGQLPQLHFSSSRSGVVDMFVVDLLGGSTVGAPQPVTELNTADLFDAGGVIDRGGRELFMFRGNPLVGVNIDIYTATRADTKLPWGAPVKVDAVNSPADDTAPSLSADGMTLFITSARAGATPAASGAPSLDIWMSERKVVRGAEASDEVTDDEADE
jgi:Tol biopolymer transport system component